VFEMAASQGLGKRSEPAVSESRNFVVPLGGFRTTQPLIRAFLNYSLTLEHPVYTSYNLKSLRDPKTFPRGRTEAAQNKIKAMQVRFDIKFINNTKPTLVQRL
jgi:hypothetical protein